MDINIFKLLLYFIIYSFFGWILESVFKTIVSKKMVNSGFLHGPFCPIYGIGAIIMYLGLSTFKNYPVLVFILGFLILSIWEYIVGWGLEKAFNTKYWDYSKNKFNIKGRVCLMNSIFWGVLGIIFIYIIHPFIEEKITYIPPGILLYIIIIAYAYLSIDAITSIIKVKNITIKVEKIHEIGETIKEKLEKLEKLKELGEDIKQNNIDTLQKAIDDLKLKQNKLKIKLYRHIYRLKNAFPSMKSDIITGILKEKVKILKRNKKQRSKVWYKRYIL